MKSPRRRDTPSSSGRRVTLTARDRVWFEMLHRHGPLPITYLYEFTKEMCNSTDAAKNRATPLFHEANTPHKGRYLTRPKKQWASDSPFVLENELVYDLAPAGERALLQTGAWRERAPHTSSRHWLHDFMASCFTASIHLATIGTEYEYIFQDEILDRFGCGLEFRSGYAPAEPRDPNKGDLKPDRMFGIKFPDGTARLFLLEIDRATEQEQLTSTARRKTIQGNAHQYRSFIGGKGYKKYFRFNGGLLVINATISKPRMESMMEAWERVYAGSCTHSLFTYLPQFGPYLKPPEPLRHLLTDPYQRVGISPFLISDS